MTCVAVTAPRAGATPAQLVTLEKILAVATCLHHGDCRGADAQSHALARRLGLYVVGHPPDNPRWRAFCDCDELRPEAPYLVRDRQMVDEVALLIGMPVTSEPTPHSGTWYTIGYSLSRRPTIVIGPNGALLTLDGIKCLL